MTKQLLVVENLDINFELHEKTVHAVRNVSFKVAEGETLALVVNDLFPEGGDLNQALFWSGLRPMTPDSTPLIGRTRFENLFLNTGHGTLGWTMSLGSAKLTADIVSGKDTEIRSDDLSLSRYQA